LILLVIPAVARSHFIQTTLIGAFMSDFEAVLPLLKPRVTRSHMKHYLRMVNLAIENHERTMRRLKKQYYSEKLAPLSERTALIVAHDRVEEAFENLSRHRNTLAQDLRLSKDFEVWRDVLELNRIDLWSSPESELNLGAAFDLYSLSSSTLDRSS
jgi:hypothetical protein